MLTHIVHPVLRLALWVFFRDIDVRGRDQVPAGVPLIFVANHPSVMMDPLIIGLNTPGKIPHFLGKGTLFKYPLFAWFLGQLGVIAVARARDEGSRMSANRDMLRAAYQVLRGGDALAIFPEGISHAQMRVHELEPGVARIALRAESECKDRAGVQIVPIGLTYSEPGVFRSDVDVHFGEAIAVRPFVKSTQQDRRAAEQELTRLLHERLTGLAPHVEDGALEAIIRDLAGIYGDEVMAQLPESEEFGRRLRANQEIIRGVKHFSETEPELVRTFARRLRAHSRKVRRVGLGHDSLPKHTPRKQPLRLVLAALLSPLALYGFIHNALPYYVPRLLSRSYRQEPEMIATVKMTTGAGLFVLWYTILAAASGVLAGATTAVVYALSLPLSGLFTLTYDEQILQKLTLWQGAQWDDSKRGRHLKRLANERAAFIKELDVLRDRYLAAKSDSSL